MTKLDELKDMLREWQRTSSVTKAYDICIYLATNLDLKLPHYRGLSTKIGMIQDEKVCRAVKAFADAACEETVRIQFGWFCTYVIGTRTKLSLELPRMYSILPDGDLDGIYSVKELCGENE